MTKAEQKKAVQFTRMCKFWKTNECQLGAECTFAHETAELLPSPKPCFAFSKTGSCKRGQACRFVHSESMKKSGKAQCGPTVHEATSGQNLLAVPGKVISFAHAGINTLPGAKLPSPYPPSMMGSLAWRRPPPGLEDMGMNGGLGGWGFASVKLPMKGDSPHSSFNEISLSLEHGTLAVPKAVDPEQIWADDQASTFCTSTTPSNFSEVDGPHEGISFWL